MARGSAWRVVERETMMVKRVHLENAVKVGEELEVKVSRPVDAERVLARMRRSLDHIGVPADAVMSHDDLAELVDRMARALASSGGEGLSLLARDLDRR